MKRLVSLFLPLLAILPASAIAAPARGVATLGSGTALPAQIVIDSQLWRCADGKCQGPAELRRVAVERVCKDLARKIGAVETLSVGGMTLGADQLANCNKGAKAS
jgi:hypothetical protein